jgi:hypothetical protein
MPRLTKRNGIRDTRVIPNTAENTDHRPVVAYLEGKAIVNKQRRTPKIPTINRRRLSDPDTIANIKREMAASIVELYSPNDDIETTWQTFKTKLVKCLTHCGITCTGGSTRKRTPWWNNEVKKAIKTKKVLAKKTTTRITEQLDD